MPVLQPGRAVAGVRAATTSTQLFKLKDSSGKHYVLAMTHEECITFHAAREIRSYRDLPQIWYHIQTKERDEPRPKSGILRTREFVMKDSYSFDRDEAGLDASYDRHIEVYRRIYDRCGLRLPDGGVGRRHDGRPGRARVHGAEQRPGRTRSRSAPAATTPPTSSWPGRRPRRRRPSPSGATRRRRSPRPGSRPSRRWPSISASTRRPPPRRWSCSRRRGRARAAAGRPPPARAEDGQGPGRRVPAGHAGGDRCQRSAPSRARSGRSGRVPG